MYGERAFWVKGQEAEKAKRRELTVILRAGDRSDTSIAPKQWLPLLEPIPVYTLILGTGNQEKGIQPDFELDVGTTVRIVSRAVRRLRDIQDADLRYGDGSAVPKTAAGIQAYLGTEMAPGKTFDPDMLFTVYWVEYLPDEMPARD